MECRTPSQDRATVVTFLTSLLGMLFFTLQMVRPYLLAVMMGAVLALICIRMYDFLRRHRWSPKIAAATVTLGLVILVLGPVALFVSVAIRQGVVLARALAGNETLSIHSVFERVSQWGPLQSVIDDPARLEKQAIASIKSAGGAASGAVLAAAADLPGLLLQLALGSLSCFFLLLDGRRFVNWLIHRIPLDTEVRISVMDSFQNTAISTIWATLAAAGTQAALMLGSYLILGVPAAFLAAGATFVFAWIPMVGSVPVWVAGAIYLYTQGAITKVIIMTILGLITGVSDNLVRPLVLKGRGEMHPLVSLVAIFGGIQLFGIMGVFVGPIIAAVLISLLNIWPVVGRRFGLMKPKPELAG